MRSPRETVHIERAEDRVLDTLILSSVEVVSLMSKASLSYVL